MLKSTREQLIGTLFAPHIPKDRLKDAEAAFRSLLLTGRYQGEFPVLASDGSLVDLEWRSIGNFVPGLHCCVARGVRERKQFEQQLQQTQKLESFGVMAGGIAHDFNNLLVGILGNSSLALECSTDESITPMLHDVVMASERASGLVRQMLTYAGKGHHKTAPTDIAQLIRETITLLKASIPKTVRLRVELEDGLPSVHADATQLQQVIMNLVINAAESIPEGKPRNVLVTSSRCRLTVEDQMRSIIPVPLSDAEYVEIRCEDTGCGMSPEVQRKIFDPFFTTKFAGRGLGLSAVLGIIRTHGGTVVVESAPGHGTTIRVLLPATQDIVVGTRSTTSRIALSAGSILVIDDEETILSTARRALEHRGFSVWTADSGLKGLELLDAHPEITAVVLHFAMPVMTGDRVAPLLRARRPDLRIILSSGYSEPEAIRRFDDADVAAFLQKPYTARTLAETVSAVLTSSAGHR